MNFRVSIILLVILVLVCGCTPAPDEQSQIATITQIAADIIATQTAQAPTATPVTPTPTLSPGATRTSPVDSMTMVYILGGEYTLGSTQADVDWAVEACLEFMDDCDASYYEDEMPQHAVQLDPYWIDQTEITYGMFAQFVEETGYETEAERFQYSYVYYGGLWDRFRDADWSDPDYYDLEDLNDNPVVNVSWYDAWAYCGWADRRLPTEAEWEAAARGVNLRIFPWGDMRPGDEHANLADRSISDTPWRNFSIEDGYSWTAPVGSYPEGASPFGVLGLAGNVREWVYDGYSPTYDLSPPAENPVHTAEVEVRVVRGGSFATSLTTARTTHRSGYDPYLSSNDFGFRCVFSDLVLPDPPERDTFLPGIALFYSETRIYERLEGSFNRQGYLKSTEGLEITGQYNQCRYLRISTPDYPEGWLRVDENIVLYKDCSEIEEIFIRPDSGSHLLFGGKSTLTVKNQRESDTYLVMVGTSGTWDFQDYSMYVRAGEQATMEHIPDDVYEVYLTSGTTWVPYEGRFKEAVSYEKLQEPMEFTSTGTTASAWELVLETVEGGNTGSVPIDESDFPSP